MKKLLIFILLSGVFFVNFLPKAYSAEPTFGALALKAGESIPENWHRVLVSGAFNAEVLSDAKAMIQLLQSSGKFKLVAVRKLALPATFTLMKAMKDNSTKIGLVLSTIAMLHTGYHSYKLYSTYQGNMNRALKDVPHHPAFSFSNTSDSFVPKFVSRLIMIPCFLIDYIVGTENRDQWSLIARNIRWSSMATYHDGVVWFGLGTTVAAIAGGASHLLTNGYSDFSSLELFFESL